MVTKNLVLANRPFSPRPGPATGGGARGAHARRAPYPLADSNWAPLTLCAPLPAITSAVTAQPIGQSIARTRLLRAHNVNERNAGHQKGR